MSKWHLEYEFIRGIMMITKIVQALSTENDATVKQREMISFQVSGMRIGKMLNIMRIKPSYFISRLPISVIKQCIKACHGCQQKKECGALLRGDTCDDPASF